MKVSLAVTIHPLEFHRCLQGTAIGYRSGEIEPERVLLYVEVDRAFIAILLVFWHEMTRRHKQTTLYSPKEFGFGQSRWHLRVDLSDAEVENLRLSIQVFVASYHAIPVCVAQNDRHISIRNC